jgi:hypothetical protein
VNGLPDEQRIISSEPWVLMTLRRRRKLFLEGLRNAALDFLIDVGKRLRNREAWVETAASATQFTVVSYVVSLALDKLLGRR